MSDKKEGKNASKLATGMLGFKTRDDQNWLRKVNLGKAERSTEKAKVTLPKLSFLEQESPKNEKK